jgi:Domain of unknown function (DUF4168)
MKRLQKSGYQLLVLLGFVWFFLVVSFVPPVITPAITPLITPAIAFAAAPVEVVESTEPEPSLLGQNLDADDISSEKIGQFVRVYLQVLQLIEHREADLQGAELELESQQIQREVEAQALDLIQASGLTLQEYLQLLSLTNIDPEFSERVAAQLQEATY